MVLIESETADEVNEGVALELRHRACPQHIIQILHEHIGSGSLAVVPGVEDSNRIAEVINTLNTQNIPEVNDVHNIADRPRVVVLGVADSNRIAEVINTSNSLNIPDVNDEHNIVDHPLPVVRGVTDSNRIAVVTITLNSQNISEVNDVHNIVDRRIAVVLGVTDNNRIAEVINTLNSLNIREVNDEHNIADRPIAVVPGVAEITEMISSLNSQNIPEVSDEHNIADDPLAVVPGVLDRNSVISPNAQNQTIGVVAANEHNHHLAGAPDAAATTHENNICGISENTALITIFSFLASGTAAAIMTLKDARVGSRTFFRLRDALLHPSLLPSDFYFIVFMVLAFTVSMIVVEALLLSMIRGLPFIFQIFLSIGVGAFFFGYAFLVKDKVPHFCVTISNHHSFNISSFWLVWLYDFSALIIFIVIGWPVAKLLSLAEAGAGAGASNFNPNPIPRPNPPSLN